MKISIITIAYNNEKDIEKTLQSVCNQIYQDVEYIIVDGNSKDGTLAIVEKYKHKIATIISEPDNGIYDAINKGVRAATGDIVGMIHAGDQLYDTTVLAKIAAHFTAHPIDISYGHSEVITSSSKVLRVNKSPEYKKRLLKFGWMPSHQSIYMKRELFEKYGYYRTDIGGSGDYEFVIRYFYLHDLSVKRLDAFIIKFAMGGLSTSNYHKILSTQKIHANCWRMNGLEPPFYMIPFKLARKIPQFVRALFK
ncbi:MAG: glycosyltransferase family 2 protein [Flavobacterium sp.]|nr:glycosyltransferase family 2 protein [Flavobacterium sp.]